MNTPRSMFGGLFGASRSAASVSVFVGLLAAHAAAFAEPSQKPLVTRPADPPPINLMVTIDDSGSMLFDFMPEKTFKVNGFDVKLSDAKAQGATENFWPMGFPADPRRTSLGYTHCTVRANKDATDNAANRFKAQFRSPDVNALYYNPDIRYRPWLDIDSLPNEMAPATFTAAEFDARADVTGSINLATVQPNLNIKWCGGYNSTSTTQLNFNPALVYRLTAGADPTKTASYTRYDINGRDGDPFSPAVKHANRTDCKASKCTQDEEKQNFANWFTYYRYREAMFKAALVRALVDYESKIRVGWALFNAANSDIDTKSRIQRGIRFMDNTVMKQVFKDIYNIDSNSGTPTREALDAVGAYFQKTGADSPWNATPGTADSAPLSCRRSANFLMSDGYYNDTYSSAGDVDGKNGPDYAPAYPTPATGQTAPTGYVAKPPYKDGLTINRSDTLADVAMKYYATDLQGGIKNEITPVEGDIAYWQHLTQFMVGLGVKGSLDSSTPAAKKATLANLTSGKISWPDPTESTSLTARIDDMWHAAVNTGGDFYSVRDVTELSEAIADAVGKATGSDAREAGVAVSSASVVTGSLKLVPKYRSVQWRGDLEAYTLAKDGTQSSSPTWTADWPVGTSGKTDWSLRKLYTWTGSEPAQFTWTAMGAANQGTVGSEALTNYTRGDTSNEGGGATYRSRAGAKFGDFINSPPLYVKDQVDLDYERMDPKVGDTASAYETYLSKKRARTTGVVFLGGNAGMLHAFDGSTGREVFGFLPQAGLSKLGKIANKTYGTATNFHQYVVDGPVVETDAYIKNRFSTAAEWSNVVVGSMGAGGTGFFALHVKTDDPTSMEAKSVLWEVSSTHATYGDDIGYVLGDIAVGKLAGGALSDGWKAFVGNGIDSKNGAASLLIVNLADGTIDKKIQVSDDTGNGLMGVSLITDTTGAVVGAYAGDLKGAIWRFDFSSATEASAWQVGFGGKPLFNAPSTQPVTVAPVSMPHGEGTGRIVMFGTGKLTTTDDATSTVVQSFYGVRDPTAIGTSSVTAVSPFADVDDDRTLLAARTASTTATVKDKISYYTITGDAIDWKTQYGWYMDLPFARQRVLIPPMILADEYVLIQTTVPAPTPDACQVTSGDGYNYMLAAQTGSQVSEPIFDTNKDGKIDDSDEAYGGYKTGGADGRDDVVTVDSTKYTEADPAPVECKEGYSLIWVGSTAAEGQWACLPKKEVPTEGLVIKDRVWRQLLNPPVPATKAPD